MESLERRTLLSAGALDPSFGHGGKVLTDVSRPGGHDIGQDLVAYQSDGKSILVGVSLNFTVMVAARYNHDGTLDTTFGNNGTAKVDFGSGYSDAKSVVVDSADRVLIGGSTGSLNDPSDRDFAVVRLTSSGELDTSFDTDGKQTVDFGSAFDFGFSVAVDSADRVLVAGYSDQGSPGGESDYDFAVARLTSSGALDTSFDSDGKQTVDFGNFRWDIGQSVAVDSADRVLIAGYSSDQGSTGHNFAVARLTTFGALDTSFDIDGRQTVDFGSASDLGFSVAVDSADRVLVAGLSSHESRGTDFAVARLTTSGALDSSFDTDGKQTIDFGSFPDVASSVAVDSADRVLVAGNSWRPTTGDDFAVARLTTSGALDSSFGTDGKQTVDFGSSSERCSSVAVDSADRVLLGGYSDQGSTTGFDFAVARLTTSGGLDAAFGGDGKVTTDILRSVSDSGRDVVAYQSEGKSVVVGGSLGDMIAVRYNEDGTLDMTFGTSGVARIDFGFFEIARSVAVDSTGRVLVAGSSQGSTGSKFAVARLTSSGTLDTSFDNDGKQTVEFGSAFEFGVGVTVDSADRVLIAGYSDRGSTGHAFVVARLTTSGALDSSFDADGKQTVDFGTSHDVAMSVAVDSADRVLVAGYSDQGSTTGYDFVVARLTTSGALDSSFGTDGKQTVDFGSAFDFGFSVAVDSADRVLVAGHSDQGSPGGGSNYDFAVARLTSSGALDTSFDSDGKQTVDFGNSFDRGHSVAVDSADRVLVAGYSARGSTTGFDFAVARLTTSGTPDTGFGTDGKQTIDFDSSADTGWSVAVDSSDRVLVAGDSWQGSQTFDDFAVTRLLSNESPTADAGGPYTVSEGSSIQLDASGNTDGGQSSGSLSYEWDLDGDGIFGETGTAAGRGDETGINPVFSAAGFEGAASLTVSLRVTDDGGLTSTDTATINVLNVVDIAGRVFDDLDNDGAFDSGESGLAGVVIELVNESAGTVAASATTLSDGTYEFDFADLGLTAVTYMIRQQAQPLGYLDGRESTGDLGGAAAENGTVVNTADSNAITGIVIGAAGTQQDTAGYNFAEIRPSSLQGLVWEDFTGDGDVDFGEIDIAGVAITLTGTDDRGNAVSLSQSTDAQGIFEFGNLRPGTYTISEAQPSGYVDGKDVVGQVNGVLTGDNDGGAPALSTTNDQFTNVLLANPGSVGINYNFGERVDGGTLGSGQTASVGYWQNKNGQSLIKSLNGSSESTLLAKYLADTFFNIYGMLADADGDGITDENGDGVNDDYMTNAEVAEVYQGLFKRNTKTAPGGPPKLDAHVMATAFATYVTKQSFVEVSYVTGLVDSSLVTSIEATGFDVTVGGAGSTFVNVGENGEAFGVTDNSDVQIIDLLLATNSRSKKGLLYDANGDGIIDDLEELDRIMANDVYSLINEAG